jgi:WD40 repeat protein
MDRYRVFLSSPTDVQQERDRAELVLRRLNAERIDHPQFEVVRWEQRYYSATSDFQAQIAKPAECQLVICIFWKRLGTELPQTYARPDGTLPTGTEYEFESALDAAARSPEKLPDVFVYRKTAEVTFSAATLELERAQYERFMGFWQRWFYSERGHFLAGFQSFAGPNDFEELFERNLRAWLRAREVQITWTKGSPFRGLEPFDIEHAPIFFGRRKEIERTRARLLACATAGKPFLLITGVSGCGKSSLARAGLIPRLRQVGGLSTLGTILRWAIVTPGQIAGDWSFGLATALFEKAAIGDELALGDFQSPSELKNQLVRSDLSAVLPLTKALKRTGEAIAAREKRSETPSVVLLILIDQFEELFAWEKTNAEAFLQLLKSIIEVPGSPIWIVATMRSDFQHRLADYATLETLAGRTEIKGPGELERTLELALPSAADLRDMILQPARAAGLSFEMDADASGDLSHLIEAEARPEVMPAVQFLLSELYIHRRDHVLTTETFTALGGVVGVMAKRGEELYSSVDDAARQAFPRVVRALVRHVGGDAPPTVRRIPQTAFADDPAAARMMEALKNGRIIISDRGELHFAHDSILTSWKRLADQIDEERRLFEARERLEQLCRRWVEDGKNSRSSSTLLLEGFQLAEGRELIAKWGAHSLVDRQPQLPAYIGASDAREKRTRRITQAVGWTLALIFVGLSWLLYEFWGRAETARREAQASLWVTNSRMALGDRRVEQAIDNASKAFALLPNQTTRSALVSALFELSSEHKATFAIGAGADQVLAWTGTDTVVFATPSENGHLRAVSTGKVPFGAISTDWPMPRVTREQDGNLATIRAICAIDPNRLLAVLDNGAVALIERGASAIYVRPLSRPMTLGATAHAAAIGRSGTLIAIASTDSDVVFLSCSLPVPAGGTLDCVERSLGVRGTAVAVSPDEARIAVGDERGAVSIYDRSGHPAGEPIAVGGSLISLDWASGHDWIAAGNRSGDIAVIDVSTSARTKIAAASLAPEPITTLAWSGNGTDLAFACEGKLLCLWPGSVSVSGALSFAPIRMFEGHSNSVTHIVWSPSADQIASGSIDGTIRIWTRGQNTDAVAALYAESATALSQVATSPDGRWIAGGAKDGTVRIWESASGTLLRTGGSSYRTEIAALAWSRSGLLVAVHDQRGITLVPADTAKPLREIDIDTPPINARIAFVESDKTLAMPWRGDNTIALIDISGSDTPVRYLNAIAPNKSPFGLAADPSGKMLFASYTDADGEIQVWDIAAERLAGAMAYTLSQKRDPIAGGSLSVSSDGRWLATSGGDNFVRVYDIPKRTSWKALPMASNEPQCVAFSPDGTQLAALGADSRVYIWKLADRGADLYLAFKALSSRSAVVEAEYREHSVTWLSWIANDRIAFAAGTSAITVLELDPGRWQRRIAAMVSEPQLPPE